MKQTSLIKKCKPHYPHPLLDYLVICLCASLVCIKLIKLAMCMSLTMQKCRFNSSFLNLSVEIQGFLSLQQTENLLLNLLDLLIRQFPQIQVIVSPALAQFVIINGHFVCVYTHAASGECLHTETLCYCCK